MRSLCGKTVLLLVSLLGSLALAELGLRVTTSPTMGEKPFPSISFLRFDPVLGWRNLPNVQTAEVFENEIYVGTNSLGFRGPELAMRKPPAGLRIVCLGDSGTFGWWKLKNTPQKVVRDDNYPAEISRLLGTRGRSDVTVVNAGVVGYSSSHGLRQLQLQILELDPDVVTVRFGFNDHNRSWVPGSRMKEPKNPLLRALLYRTVDWRLVRLGLSAYRTTVWLHPAPFSIPWVTPENFAENLRRFAETGRREGFHVLFIDYPLASPDSLNRSDLRNLIAVSQAGSVRALLDRHDAHQGILRTVAREQEVPLLETAATFANATERFFSKADMVHPNQAGARRLAELLLDRLDELGWLEPTR